MKLSRSFLSIFLVVICIILLSNSVQAQLGNQSDITNPDPQEVIIPDDSVSNQSDITNPDSQEVIIPDDSVENQSDITNPDSRESTILTNSSENPANTTNFDAQKISTPNNPSIKQSDNTNQNSPSSLTGININRQVFDNNFAAATDDEAVAQVEEMQALQYGAQLNTNLFGELSSSEDIADELSKLAKVTQKKAAVIYITSLKDKLSLIMIPPIAKVDNLGKKAKNLPKKLIISSETNLVESGQIVRKYVEEANSLNVQKVAREFRSKVTDFQDKSYVKSAKELYEWIIDPLIMEIKANKIDTLIFSMDNKLRSIPIAALYDGKQFLIEKYSVGIIPSFNLTDTRYFPIIKADILAMGISRSTEDQDPLPSVPLEIDTVSKQIWQSQNQILLNEELTTEKIASLSSQKNFGIIHLATHGDFQAGQISNSYIQLWDKKLNLDELKKLSQELKWNKDPKVEMLVLSACRTALGNQQAELGFSGLAVQAGVKSVLGSLWYVSDQGSLALITKFYEQLKLTSLRSESLRQAQIGMLKGEVRITDKYLYLSPENRIALPPEVANLAKIDLSHPYYWSAFTMIGNWN
ncbi:CHAT domain-containing protein [Dolichospermum sp. UHCC 0259]|uniref:CHAT domain-containing protein n=1 Tax=Dolichospermum sp. UHCC 0259 TaxID=2590010 RepID=UPI001445DE6C|nr:CHAT domain-containing protein [Dolichospermum sp. UHCC 0259]MTJ50163.1 CHAT domain-containing protein [Dolichospermum sp. UHCC 0259]